MQKIVPHLWFDKEAKEAAEFYTSVFPNSKVKRSVVIKDTPSGDCDFLTFDLNGYEFMAISAGPYFKINPSISFLVNFDPSVDSDAEGNLKKIWEKLSDGGEVLMPLQEYPHSKLYGWINDKFGVSWQLMLTNPEGEPRPFIIPVMMFVNEVAGKAEEAINFYVSTFKNSKLGILNKYPAGMEPDKEGTIMFADFQLEGLWFAAMDSARDHKFNFNEAVSLLVRCETQEEIDQFWQKLSAVPEAEQCGWLKDKYGVSWQISPTLMDEAYDNATEEQMKRLTESFLKMKKFDIAELERAYHG